MFNKKSIRVEIQKEPDATTWEESDVYIFENTPIEVKIERSVPYNANVKIYGLSKQDMDGMTTLVWQYDKMISRKIRIFATDGGNNYVLLFTGFTQAIIPNYNSAPNVYLEIQSYAGNLFNYVDIPPSTHKGEIPAPKLIEQLANYVGLSFYNYGVEANAVNPYFDSFGLNSRVDEIADAYNFNVVVTAERISIYPKVEEKKILEWKVSPDNFIGYPSFTTVGINVVLDEIFDINYDEILTIENSTVKAANDSWLVKKVVYSLSTKLGGKWQMQVDGVRNVAIQKK